MWWLYTGCMAACQAAPAPHRDAVTDCPSAGLRRPARPAWRRACDRPADLERVLEESKGSGEALGLPLVDGVVNPDVALAHRAPTPACRTTNFASTAMPTPSTLLDGRRLPLSAPINARAS